MMETFVQIYVGIDNLPPKKEGTIYIVPLFILDAIERFSQTDSNIPNLYRNRNDLRAPGKKIFGEGGKILYAKGLKSHTEVARRESD